MLWVTISYNNAVVIIIAISYCWSINNIATHCYQQIVAAANEQAIEMDYHVSVSIIL